MTELQKDRQGKSSIAPTFSKRVYKKNKIVGTALLLNTYEGCQKSSWTHMIEASNEPDFDIHYYISLK